MREHYVCAHIIILLRKIRLDLIQYVVPLDLTLMVYFAGANALQFTEQNLRSKSASF